jgi:hypothetical protein
MHQRLTRMLPVWFVIFGPRNSATAISRLAIVNSVTDLMMKKQSMTLMQA